jgi:RHS repeat-associated protein
VTATHDGVGNRVTELATISGVSTNDAYSYPVGSNRLVQITRGTSTRAAMTYDASGNLLTDSRLGLQKAYTYNNRNRMATMGDGTTSYAYTYNGREQLAIRQKTAGMAPLGTTHFVHDIFGNVIAETSGTAAGTKREYIWLPETEIAPTREAMSQVDRPLAVVNGVGTTGIVVWNVSVDHLNRPVLMTNSAKVTQWQAVWQPWGGAHSITGPAGTAANDYRLPGQWYQLESGLHYNWHRQYDPSIGRYTQADPLGFVDGPSVYGYARGKPIASVDPDGRLVICGFGQLSAIVGTGFTASTGGCVDFFDSLRSETYIAGGVGVGFDAGQSVGATVFFGDFCQFSGRSFNINFGFGLLSGTISVGGGGLGLSVAAGESSVPATISTTFTYTQILRPGIKCDCRTWWQKLLAMNGKLRSPSFRPRRAPIGMNKGP